MNNSNFITGDSKEKHSFETMRMPRLLFIIPPYFNVQELLKRATTSTLLPAFTVPYGILSIHAYVRKHVDKHIDFELLDLNISAHQILMMGTECPDSYFQEVVKKKVEEFKPHIVGISALFDTSYGDLVTVSKAVKEANQQILVIAGGGVPTNLHSQVLAEVTTIDAICYGEGEIPMADLLNAADYEELIASHPSWGNRKTELAGKVLRNTFVQDLDEIPEFDYSLINMDNYNARSSDKHYAGDGAKREMSIHTSRGCPFNCVFCANGRLHGKKIRFMSVAKVTSEVARMKDEYGATVLLIEDDNFLADKKRAKKILKELTKFQLRIEFPNGLAVYGIDTEVAELMKQAGVSVVNLAIESGSDHVLKNIIDKPLSVTMINEKVQVLRDNGILIHAFIVIGLPGEMDEHRQETIDMLKNVGVDWVHIAIAIPIVGSRLYDICVANDYLVSNDFKNHIISKANIKAPGVNPRDIERIAYKINLLINFVDNYNMAHGQFEKAAGYFKTVVDKYPEHAFAHYCLAKAYKEMGWNTDLIQGHLTAYEACKMRDSNWRQYAEDFQLPPLVGD